jgi:ankyrin repeat protein
VNNHSYSESCKDRDRSPGGCRGRLQGGRPGTACWDNLPLHRACADRDTEAVRRLLAEGADPCSIDEAGDSPLSIAIAMKHSEAIRLLVDAGALRANYRVQCPFLVHLPETGDLDLLGYVLARGKGLVSVSDHDADGRTALHYAVYTGHERMLLLIVTSGFDLNPLFIQSAKRGDYFWVKGSIDHGSKLIDVNATDASGNSALHYAMQNHDERMAKLLVASGADVNLRNAEGRTPAAMGKA